MSRPRRTPLNFPSPFVCAIEIRRGCSSVRGEGRLGPRRARLGRRLAVEEAAEPDLEVDERPQSLGVVTLAGDVLADDARDELRVEDAAGAGALTGDVLVEDVA